MLGSAAAHFDLDSYLARIEYAGNCAATAADLSALHLAHTSHIPFENLDVLAGAPIRLDIESLQAKLVRGGRGGYCFEQNLLFATALEAFGFEITPLAARVRYHTHRLLPRTHMLLLVSADGKRWLCDVGFGGEGLLLPIQFVSGNIARQYAWTYRLVEESTHWVLQALRDKAWLDLYAFTLEPQHLVDYEVTNYYVSTHPQSRFTQTLAVQLSTPAARYTLRNREFNIDRGATSESRKLADDRELLDVLASTFGLRFAPGTQFTYREWRED